MSKWAYALAFSALIGCVAPPPYAQVDVVLESDAELLSSATGVRLRVFQGRTSMLLRDQVVLMSEGLAFPTTAVIVPIENDPSREFRVLAELLQGNTVLATQQLISNFVPNTAVSVTLRFTTGCGGGCGPLENCVESACVPACFSAAETSLSRETCQFVDPCIGLDVIYCDSFEEEREQGYSQFDPDTYFERSSEVFYGGGGHSGHIFTPEGAMYAFFTVSELSAEASGSQWVRSWWRLPSGVLDLTFFSLESDINALDYSVGLYTGGADYTVAYPYGFSDEDGVPSVQDFPQDEWFCLETHIDYDTDRIDFFVNSANAMTVEGEVPEPFRHVRFGTVYRPADDFFDYSLYVDDIVISDTRIGCD